MPTDAQPEPEPAGTPAPDQSLEDAGNDANAGAGHGGVNDPCTPCPVQTAEIAVHVQSPSGAPISGCAVQVVELGMTGATDQDGNYYFGEVEPRTYTVEGHKGSAADVQSQSVPAGNCTQFILTLPSAHISVHVQGADGSPKACVAVRIVETGAKGATGEDGNYDFGDVDPGTYTVEGVKGPLLDLQSQDCPAATNTVYTLTIAMARISVHVQAPNGGPIGDMSVQVVETAVAGTTNPDGNYEFGEMPPGTYTVECIKGSVLASQKKDAPAATETVYTLTIAVTVTKVTPDTDDYRQYINAQADAGHPQYGRSIASKAYLDPPIEALLVFFSLKPDGGNKTHINSSVLATDYTGDKRIRASTAAGGIAESDRMTLSAYGGDVFEIEAATDYTPSSKAVSKKITIWRWLKYDNVYSMAGENYIDAATLPGEIEPAYTPAFITYTRGAVTTLAPGLTVKYIGLFDDSAVGKQKNWPADFSPTKLESSPHELEPTPDELADYAGADATKKAAAKAAIEAKAAKWSLKIVEDYASCCTAWFNKIGGLPGNSLLAVQYYHPKLSAQGDGATNFWPAGISINLENPGSGLTTLGDPDQATWRQVQGFNSGTTSVVFKNYGSAARLQIVCRHEIGHATKGAFGRTDFGTGDHSASGLMTPWGSADTFSNTDLNLLRGFKEP